MLEGLPAVDWSQFQHAYGPAEDIPSLILGLSSSDPEEWVGAISGLYDTLCHQQCTVYEATPHAIPFLVELLMCPDVRCRGRILEFLADCTRATSFLAAHGSLDLFAAQRDTDEFKIQLTNELEWVRRTRAAAWRGLDVYLDLVSDLDKRIRIAVPYTLASIAEYAASEKPTGASYERVASHLSMHLEDEPNDLVRASIVFALGRFVRRCPELHHRLERLMTDQHEAVQLAVALGLADLESGRISAPVAEYLLDQLDRGTEIDGIFNADEPRMEDRHHPLYKAYREAGLPLDENSGAGFDTDDVGQDEDFKFPWAKSSPSRMIVERLALPGAPYSARFVQRLASNLETASPHNIESIAEPIFQMIFAAPAKPPKPIGPPLDSLQQDVLLRIFNNYALWATDISNGESCFWKWGLPDSRNALRELLDIQEPPLTDDRIDEILRRLAPTQQYGSPSEVKRLNLRQIGSAEFLPHLAKFPFLEELDMSSVPLSDASLHAIVALPMLARLQLPNTGLTSAAAGILAQCRKLQKLNLSCTGLIDSGLELLERLDLQELHLYKTSVSDEAVARFKTARPNCRVWR